MDREIKFRGKRIDNGEWVYGSYHFIKGEGAIRERTIEKPYYKDTPASFDYHLILEPRLPEDSGWHTPDTYLPWKVDKVTVGQFTGVVDRNSKYIFQDDIIKDGMTGISYQVMFGVCQKHGFYGWFLRPLSNMFQDRPLMPEEGTSILEYFGIIGNIYETPHLLNTQS